MYLEDSITLTRFEATKSQSSDSGVTIRHDTIWYFHAAQFGPALQDLQTATGLEATQGQCGDAAVTFTEGRIAV